MDTCNTELQIGGNIAILRGTDLQKNLLELPAAEKLKKVNTDGLKAFIISDDVVREADMILYIHQEQEHKFRKAVVLKNRWGR